MEPLEKEPNPLYEELIGEIKKREAIWNPKHKRHRSRKVTIKAWAEIANNLNISEFAAKMKWKMLRTIFQRHFKQYKPNTAEDYSGKWQYFKSLWFLHDTTAYIKGRRKNFTAFKTYFNDTGTDGNVSLNPNEKIEEDEENNDDHASNKFSEDANINLDDTSEEKNESRSLDSNELFLMSLAPFMNKLNPMRNLIVRSRFQEILMTEIRKGEDK